MIIIIATIRVFGGGWCDYMEGEGRGRIVSPCQGLSFSVCDSVGE